MNKPLVGVAVGAVLGIVDGATAWFTPEVRPEIAGILMGSCIKGMLVGVLSGAFARKVQSNSKGILFGAVVGLIFAAVIAVLQGSHYLEILLPGFVLGGVIGFLTQRWGNAPAPKPS